MSASHNNNLFRYIDKLIQCSGFLSQTHPVLIYLLSYADCSKYEEKLLVVALAEKSTVQSWFCNEVHFFLTFSRTQSYNTCSGKAGKGECVSISTFRTLQQRKIGPKNCNNALVFTILHKTEKHNQQAYAFCVQVLTWQALSQKIDRSNNTRV